MTTSHHTQDAAASADAAPSAAAAGAPFTGAGLATQITVLSQRSIKAYLGDKRQLITSLMMPVIMLLLFSQVFGSIANTAAFPPGVTYINYLVPAIIVTTVMSAATSSGVGLVSDLESGVLNRFRSLPINLLAVPTARSLAGIVRSTIQAVAIIALAFVFLGFRPAGGIPGLVAAIGVAVVLGFGLAWIFLALGASFRHAETVQSISMVVLFPLMFASSAYVPVASLPTWLQVIAKVNPLTYAIDASRHFCLGQPSLSATLLSVLISCVVAAIGMIWAARAFRKL